MLAFISLSSVYKSLQPFFCDPISFPPSALALDKYVVSCGEAREWERMLMFPVEHGDPPQAASALSLFVISFPMAKDKGQRTYEEHAFLM